MKIALIIFFIGFYTSIHLYGNEVDSLQNLQKFNEKVNTLKKELDYYKAIDICKELELFSKKHITKHLNGKAEIEKLKTYKRFKKYALGLELALFLEQKYIEDSNYLNCNDIYYLERYLYDYMLVINNNVKAISHLHHILKLACYKNNSYSIIYYEIALAHTANNKQNKAKEVLKNRIFFLEQNKDSIKLIGAYNQFGLLLSVVEEKEKAIIYFEKALKTINKTKQRERLSPTINGNIGQIYLYKNQLELAEKYLQKDAIGSILNKEYNSYASAQIALAQIQANKKNHKVSIAILETLYIKYYSALTNRYKKSTLLLLSQYHGKQKHFKKAYFYLKEYTLLDKELNKSRAKKYKSLLNEYTKSLYSISVKDLELKTIMAKNDLESLKKVQKNENQKNQLLIFSLLISIGLITLWFKRMYDNKKKDNEITKTKLLVSKQELELQATKQKVLELKSETDNKKINKLALELNLKKEFAEKLIKKLEQLQNLKKSDIRNIELFVQNELDLKSTRAKLHKDIDELGSSFFDSLLKKHPILTDSDLNLCSLIIFKLPNKEIAISKNIATNSVKIAKNRLKKKLNLSTEDVLLNYLEQFM